jgi:hypothetical protein
VSRLKDYPTLRNSIGTSDIRPSETFNLLNCVYIVTNSLKMLPLVQRSNNVPREYQNFHHHSVLLAFKYTNVMNIVHITILGYAISGDLTIKQQRSNNSQGQYLQLVREFLVTNYVELYAVKHFHNYVGQGHYLQFMCKAPILSLTLYKPAFPTLLYTRRIYKKRNEFSSVSRIKFERN